MRFIRLTTALVCGALALACQDSVGPSDAKAPVLSSAEGLQVSGAQVVRRQPPFPYYWISPDQAFTVLAGLSQDQWMALVCDDNYENDEPATATRQLVVRPDGSISVLYRMRKAPVLVYQGDISLTGFSAVCSSTPYAAGAGNVTATDNDLGTSLERTRSFAGPDARLTATVVDANGRNHHLLITFHALVHKDGAYSQVVSRFELN